MATHRIILTISDEEILLLSSVLETLDEVASLGEMNDDYATEVNHVNVLYANLEDVYNRISQGVLAQ